MSTSIATPNSTPSRASTPASSFDWGFFLYRLRSSPLTVVGLVMIVTVLLLLLFAPLIATHDPNAINLKMRLLAPSAAHWFGTDEVGRDLFSRVIYGGQLSVGVGVFVVAIAEKISAMETAKFFEQRAASVKAGAAQAAWDKVGSDAAMADDTWSQ